MSERDDRRQYLAKLAHMLCSDSAQGLCGVTADGYGNQLRAELRASERDRERVSELEAAIGDSLANMSASNVKECDDDNHVWLEKCEICGLDSSS